MTKRHRPPRSRVKEKAARAPRLPLTRYEKAISRYLDEVRSQRSETARSQRFTLLLNELFGDLEFPIIRDYLAGLEKSISAQESEKCRVLRGRPDALFGNLVVEFERGASGWFKEAKRQLERFLAILRRNPENSDRYFIPIATDGVSFKVFAPREGQPLTPDRVQDSMSIEQVEEFDLGQRQPLEFYFWLDRYFLRREPREPKAENFVQDFGTDSAAFREATGLWQSSIDEIRERSDFKVIYHNWRKYLRLAYGSAVGDEHLFVRHTFLATLAKIIAYVRITDARHVPDEAEVSDIMQGTFFEKKGILNFLEEDFFSWAGREPVIPTTQRVVLRLCNSLFTYNLRELSEDVLKELYQQIVGSEERHGLGEYYTPDWLAAKMCEELLDDEAGASILDPACGSGTFLYQTIQHKKRRLPATKQSLNKILGSVVGIDIHPLAVIISKTNVLLALGDLFQKRSGPVSIQVYLANSIRHPEKEPFMGNGGIPAEKVILNERAVLIPDVALASPANLDAAVGVAEEFAKAHKAAPKLDADAFSHFVRRRESSLAESTDVVHMLCDLADLFHEFIRKPEDSIWAYILKNQYKPTFLREGFDILIGNPPWLSFRFVEKGEYQSYLKRLIVDDCGLLEGSAHLIAHLELGTLFFVHCASLYLKPSGKIGFVLPRSIFTADQHDRFRRSLARGNATLTELWDLDEVAPLFNVPAAVAFGDVASEAKKLLPGKIFSGELPRRNSSLAEANDHLLYQPTEFHVVQQGERSYVSTSRQKISRRRSYYQPFFKEGATIVPRNFWFVQIKEDPRLGINKEQPFVLTDPRAEAEAKLPYKGTHFEGPIEADFLYATLLSTDLLPFGHFEFRPIVVPMLEDVDGYQLLSPEQARNRGYLRLAEWLERAQSTWTRKRREKASRMDILQRLDIQRGLTGQDRTAKYVVLYPKSATFLCAAVVPAKAIAQRNKAEEIPLKAFVADYVTYYFETSDRNEALYLSAVLNSPRVDALIKPMQARGLWGPRDITKKVWELPIPEYDQSNRGHTRLAEIAASCEDRVRDLLPSASEQGSIGRARGMVRESLKAELGEIDSIVTNLLK